MSKATARLYFTDSYLTSFQAQVLEAGEGGDRVVLDRTAFYPTSGGQPHDLGTIDSIPVLDVIDENGCIVHLLQRPLQQNEANCVIDWPRRWDHTQQHTGQHLLSAVLADLFGVATVSFHMGAESSTIDLAAPTLSPGQIEAAEVRANAVIHENRPVYTAFEDASAATGLRKPTERTGPIRVVTIESLDRSACGGTHVRSTGEIGAILLRSVEKVRGNVRLEFVCGNRAIRSARADYNALDQAARAFSAKLMEVPAIVAANLDRLKDAEKTRRRLETELAGFRGRALHAGTNPNASGLRVVERMIPHGPLGEDLRNEANAFVTGGRALYIAVAEAPPSAMLAGSADANVHCGNLLKQVLSEFAGRGGGSATFAQGSFTGDIQAFLERLRGSLTAAGAAI